MGDATIGSGGEGYNSPPILKSGGHRGYKLQHMGYKSYVVLAKLVKAWKTVISKNVYDS